MVPGVKIRWNQRLDSIGTNIYPRLVGVGKAGAGEGSAEQAAGGGLGTASLRLAPPHPLPPLQGMVSIPLPPLQGMEAFLFLLYMGW